MEYYLKYLKYKEKYLDLKYNDLEGGKYGLKTGEKYLNEYNNYNLEGIKDIDDMEKLAIEWNRKVSTTSYSTTQNERNRIQPGYYFNFNFINSSNPIQSNAPSLDAPPLDTPLLDVQLLNAQSRSSKYDFNNHIHVISVENKHNFYKVMFILKVNGSKLKLDEVIINEIFKVIKDETDIKKISKLINVYLSYKKRNNIAIENEQNLRQYIYEENLENCIKKLIIYSIICKEYLKVYVRSNYGSSQKFTKNYSD
jgi:hypothetical protein